MMKSSAVARLRLVGLMEGISFLLLLCVAMPLKYFAGFPMAVTVVGMAHGVLFMAFGYALVHAKFAAGWSIPRTLLLFAASVVPLGPFLIDGWLRREARALAGS